MDKSGQVNLYSDNVVGQGKNIIYQTTAWINSVANDPLLVLQYIWYNITQVLKIEPPNPKCTGSFFRVESQFYRIE